MHNFILQNLGMEQRKHAISGKLIYALESGDEVPLLFLHVFLKEFSLSKETAGQPGRDKTLKIIRKAYY